MCANIFLRRVKVGKGCDLYISEEQLGGFISEKQPGEQHNNPVVPAWCLALLCFSTFAEAVLKG